MVAAPLRRALPRRVRVENADPAAALREFPGRGPPGRPSSSPQILASCRPPLGRRGAQLDARGVVPAA
eukprot:6774901-Pyramimonas_sp.AAC.1